jgi:signal transduction histidine kinase
LLIIKADDFSIMPFRSRPISNNCSAIGSGDGPQSPLVLISVADSGPGLDPSKADHQFYALYKTNPQGLGMGLSISRSIIEAHGGRLWARTKFPKGALFQFTLPAAVSDEQ